MPKVIVWRIWSSAKQRHHKGSSLMNNISALKNKDTNVSSSFHHVKMQKVPSWKQKASLWGYLPLAPYLILDFSISRTLRKKSMMFINGYTKIFCYSISLKNKAHMDQYPIFYFPTANLLSFLAFHFLINGLQIHPDIHAKFSKLSSSFLFCFLISSPHPANSISHCHNPCHCLYLHDCCLSLRHHISHILLVGL